MKSIIQDDNVCYICKKMGFDTPGPEEHHMLHGNANRRLAEKDGLKCQLCSYHHKIVHDTNSEWDKKLQKEAQIRYMEYYEKSVDEFRERYGKNYL